MKGGGRKEVFSLSFLDGGGGGGGSIHDKKDFWRGGGLKKWLWGTQLEGV